MTLSRNAQTAVLWGLSLCGMVLLGCGGAADGKASSTSGGSGGVTAGYQPVTSVAVTPTTIILTNSMQQTFTALAAGPEASAFPERIAWTTDGGTLSTASGSSTNWTAPASGPAGTYWVKATSTWNPAASATATVTFSASEGSADQETLAFMDSSFLQNAYGHLFAVGTASPIWQTFKPTCSVITGISLFITVNNAQYGSDTATLKIKNQAGDVIGTASALLDISQFKSPYGWKENRTIYFPVANVAVIPNETYMLVLEGTKHTFGWGTIGGDKYLRGQAYWNNLPWDNGASDFLFRVYGK